MKVEVIEFYPSTSKKIYGTVHVYLEEYDIDLRGVYIRKVKNSFFVSLPHQKASDENKKENGKSVTFPVLTFANPQKAKDLKDSVIKAVLDFLKTHKQKKS